MKKGQPVAAGNLRELFLKIVSRETPAEKAVREKAQRAARNQRHRAKKRETKKRNIAILDMETDPFDNISQDEVLPFLAVLHCDEQAPVIIWNEDHDQFTSNVIAAIEALPGKYTVYAHNGGKFDFMFLVHKLRGKVSFKGRGIMSATIGNHELRDSFHIIPEKLASLQKQQFDYSNLTKSKRAKFKKQIIAYCISDCENLLYYVKKFIDEFGFKISIGAAALAKLSENYTIEKITDKVDENLRRFFFGGRVECVQGAGYFRHGQKLYDINSAYPNAMARQRHPIGAEYVYRPGLPNENTCFLQITCRNENALMARTETGEVTTRKKQGEFFTTIWEYRAALELGLISDVKIIHCVDNFVWTDFSKFINPLYDQRAIEKAKLATLTPGSEEWNATNAAQTFLKLIMNNSYGKTAQNPRRFKEHYFTDPGETPILTPGEEDGPAWETEFLGADYWIWTRPSPGMKFLNVGTGASITGAVRAKLLHALHHAINPVYCDTDSIICDALPNETLHATELGAWDIEKEITELVICGKKLYAYRAKGKNGASIEYVKSKGAAGLSWSDMIDIFTGQEKRTTNFGPTLTRFGNQSYISRRIKSTVEKGADDGQLIRSNGGVERSGTAT